MDIYCIFFINFLYGYTAVSYTHLDVYKRQDSTSIRELRAEPTVVEALKEILPLDQIPGQYLGHTLQEVAELFPAAASADKLEKVQDVLEKIG